MLFMLSSTNYYQNYAHLRPKLELDFINFTISRYNNDGNNRRDRKLVVIENQLLSCYMRSIDICLEQ